MNRFSIRLRSRTVRRLAIALIATAATAGCGTGQIAQTTDQAPAVNGSAAAAGDITLRDVRIEAVQNGDAIPAGSTVDLSFVASNQSSESDDQLVRISTDIGKISLTGAKSLPVGGVLIVAPPETSASVSPTELKQLRGVEELDTATATLTLDKPISNGLTYDFTFEFKKAGPIKLAVPISAQAAAQAAAHRAHY